MMYKCVIEFEIKLNGGVLHGVLYLNYIVHIQKKKFEKYYDELQRQMENAKLKNNENT